MCFRSANARAFRLNQYAIGLKSPQQREAFAPDKRAAMEAAGLSPTEMEMIAARDWTALIAHGGHVLAIVKIAYALGILHHEVCAHMCGMTYADYGHAFDGRAGIPFMERWQQWFDGLAAVKEWIARQAPTHVVVIYNDHLNYFDLTTYPTFAIGMSDFSPDR